MLNTQGQLFNLHIHLFTHSQGIPKLGVKFHECTRMHNHSWNWQYLFYDLSCFINFDDIVFHGLSWPGIVFHCNVFVSNVSDRNWLFWWWYLCGVCDYLWWWLMMIRKCWLVWWWYLCGVWECGIMPNISIKSLPMTPSIHHALKTKANKIGY